MYYVDVDGFMTEQQKRWAKPKPEVIARVKAMIKAGCNVCIWSGTQRYVDEWCEANGFTGEYEPYAKLPKPKWMADNQTRVIPDKKDGGGRILGRRYIITPEKFMKQTAEYGG